MKRPSPGSAVPSGSCSASAAPVSTSMLLEGADRRPQGPPRGGSAAAHQEGHGPGEDDGADLDPGTERRTEGDVEVVLHREPLGAGGAQLPGNLHHVAERQPECQRHEEQAQETQNLQHHWRSSPCMGGLANCVSLRVVLTAM